MKVKEKVINETINRITKRLDEIKILFEANPVSRICEIRMEANKLLEQYKSVKERTSDEFIAHLDRLANEEKKQFAIAKKLSDSVKLMDEQVELEMELGQLKNELYHIHRQRER